MNCGLEPLSDFVVIEKAEFMEYPDLKIKAKASKISLIHKLMNEEINEHMLSAREKDEDDHNKCRRTKERRIGHIIQKVFDWRQLYSTEDSKISL